MLTPLLNLLRRRYGLACNVIGTGSWTASIYEGNPDVASVQSFDRHLPFILERAWRNVRSALRDSASGPIYICERHYRQLPRIRRMLAWSGVDPARCVFISEETDIGREHLVDRLTRFAGSTPAAADATRYPCPQITTADGPRLYVLDSERAERDAWRQSEGWGDRPYILIQPGNHRTMGPRRDRWRRLNTDDKAWPADRWISLIHKVHGHMKDALIVLRGSPEEVPMLSEIKAAAALESVVVAGQGLRRLFALTDAAHSVISVDTGPAHAAAALGVPLVVLYGAESPLYWLPRTASGSPVIGVGGPPVSVRADQVSVESLFDAWCAMVARLPGPDSKRATPGHLPGLSAQTAQ